MLPEFTIEDGGFGTVDLTAELIATITATLFRDSVMATIVASQDRSGVHEVADPGGPLGRQYVGESRFVAILGNTTVASDRQAFLVARSLFFETRMHAKLSARTTSWPYGNAKYLQNSTSASNSDPLQQVILLEGISILDVPLLTDLLTHNASGGAIGVLLALSNDAPLWSLPDDALRMVPYAPLYNTPSSAYAFAVPAYTPPKPIWEQIWEGLVATVTSWIASAIVFAVTAFVKIAEALLQVGNWFAQVVSQAAAAVASAVEAAAKVVEQVVNALADAILAVIHAALDPLINLVVSAYTAWANEVAQLILSMPRLSVDDFVRGLIQLTFFSAFALAIFGIIVAFSVAEKITNAMTLGLANLAGIVVGAVAGLIIGMLVVAAINEWLGSTAIEDLLPPGFDEITGATFTIAQLFFVLELRIRPLKPIQGVETALKDAIVALFLLGASSLIRALLGETITGLASLVVLDAAALAYALFGIKDMVTISGRGANLVRVWYPFLYPVTIAMNAISVATTATDLVSNAGKLTNALGGAG